MLHEINQVARDPRARDDFFEPAAASAWARGLWAPDTRRRLIFIVGAVAAGLVSIASAPGTIGLLGAGLAIVMLTIAVIDARSFVIPDWLNAAGLALALIHAALAEPERVPAAMAWAVAVAALRGAALAFAFLAIRSLYGRIRGRQGLGLGDVKLAGVAGAWLDWPIMPIAVEIAAFAALSTYALRQFMFRRRVRATNRVPFGLFLAPSIWVCWLLETTLF